MPFRASLPIALDTCDWRRRSQAFLLGYAQPRRRWMFQSANVSSDFSSKKSWSPMTQSSFATRSLRQPVHPPVADRLRPLEAAARRSAAQVTFCVRGVISPLLCNLFLNYAFDRWMVTHYPEIPFERFADDILCHCGSESQAQALKSSLERRFAECELELHPTKTRSSTARMMID